MFIGKTYLHLLGATGITAASSTFPLRNDWWWPLACTTVSILLIFPLVFLPPGLLKYLCYFIFAAALGQALSLLEKKLVEKKVLTEVIISVAGIFLGMTLAGFLDNQNILGFGGYLFAALCGLCLARLGLAMGEFMGGDSNALKLANKWTTIFGTILFSIYVAYDTQVLKARAFKAGKNPDYVSESIGLYLDLLNLFEGVGSLAVGD